MKTTDEERVKQAALAFAMSKPVQWDDFREKWMLEHPKQECEEIPVVETAKTEEKLAVSEEKSSYKGWDRPLREEEVT